ncbi:type VII secretion-associated serine protease mycosin [Nocardia alni]|uniref:type VII secretion-associated serine protease mycosin n=1 Tax=Nocardia alni TaxID=2815723 RepID=UPI001C219FCD|nr:type VII secretion-associated serine protease mycosin [Nocardia alni]
MRLRRIAVAAVSALTVVSAAGPGYAMQPPQVLIGAPLPDGPPGPELPTEQDQGCLATGVLPQTDLTQVPQPEQMLNLKQARTLSRGAGVTVAVIDTGVTPDTRLPHLIGGGDYVTVGGNGLSDCDAHGTLVAGIIGAAPSTVDGFTGVAPDAQILSIRYRSSAFDPKYPPNTDQSFQVALQIRTLARAITHAANLGAGVIVVPSPICESAGSQVDQSMLAAAVGYAVHTRGAVVVAGAGSISGNCEQNPDIDPTRPSDPRNWRDVKTVATPDCFGSDVLSVGYTTQAGVPVSNSMLGPWVSLGAPGTGIESLGPGGPNLINGVAAGNQLTAVGGADFAAAYVAGTAALLRSRFPDESPDDIITRLLDSAHAPAGGVDDAVGAGIIDPVAALGYRAPPRPPAGIDRAGTLAVPPPPRPADPRPGLVALAVIAVMVLLGAGVSGVDAVIRRRG